MRVTKKFVVALIGILVVADIIVWGAVSSTSRQKVLEVTFFDVGQGDAIFTSVTQLTLYSCFV